VDGGTKKGGGEAVDLGRLRSAREEAGGRALAEAAGFAGEHEGAAKEVVEKFRKVVREHEGTRAAGQARARAEEMEKAWWGGVRREYASREERAARALAEGRLGAALGEWATVPDEWAGTDAGEKAGARRREIEELAEKRTAEAEGLARSAVAGDPAGAAAARDALTAVGGCGIEKFAARARAARERLDRTLEDRDRRLQAAEAAWERVAGEAILAAPAGTKVVEEVLAKDAAALEPVEGKVEALRGYLAEMGLFVDAARRAFGKAVAAGEKVRLRTPGRPGGAVSGRAAGVKPEGFEIARGPAADLVPLVEIAPEDVAALAWSEIGSGGPKDHRGAVLYYLSRGAFAQADQALQALAVVDPSADSALVPALAGSTRAAARARADAALREADLFRMQKRPVEAKAAFARAVSLCEGYSRPLWKMGAFLLESEKDVDAALAVLDGAAALLPEDPEAWYWIAEARRRKGRGPEAVEAFARFLAQAPQDSPLRATAKSAEEEIRKALRDSQARAAREEAGRAFRREKWDEAEELWKRVLDLLPGDAEALYFHGKSCLQQGRNLDAYLDLRASLAGAKSGARVDDARKAVKDLEQRLGDSPAAARSHQEGVSLFGQGKWREAAAAYGRALETAPLRLESYYGRAESLRQSWMAERNTADLAAAEADLRVALRLNKQYAPALCGLAAVLYEREDWAKAAEVAAKAMEKDRGSSVVCEVLASALLKLDRPLEAEEAAGEGYRREARPILLLLRAEARARQRKTKEARADLDLVDDKHELSPGERQYRAQVLGMVIEAERGQ